MAKSPAKIPSNPFTPGINRRPPLLAGRGDQEDRFRRLMRNQGLSLLFYGLRGTGKTVLLNHLRDMLRAETEFLLPGIKRWAWSYEFHQLLSEGAPLEEVIERVVVEVVGQISPSAKILDDAKGIASTVEKVGLGPVSGERKPQKRRRDISTMFRMLADVAKSNNTGVVLFFDEAQVLTDEEMKTLLAAFISAQHASDIRIFLVMAGLPSLVGKIGRAYNSPDRIFDIRRLAPLDETDTARALAEPSAREGKSYTSEALDRAAALTRGYPVFIQNYGFTFWEGVIGDSISLDDVERIRPLAEQTLRNNFYGPKWLAATPPERRLLAAMVEVGGPPYMLPAISKVLGIRSGINRRERKKLLQAGVIFEASEDLGDQLGIGYDFAYPGFAEFVKAQPRRAIH